MILSFSRPEMVPWLKAGLLKAEHGDRHGGDVRVKRQTIRHRGPRAAKLLEFAAVNDGTIPYALHLWWKSRTPERELIGVVEPRHWPRVHPITIVHQRDVLLIDAAEIFSPHGFTVAAWRPWVAECVVADFARADGFDSVEAFRDFFVPNEGDRFDAILFKW